MAEHEGRAPAPGGLRLVEDFINSRDYPSGPDELATPEAAVRWLGHRGIHADALSAAECGRLRELREHLRDLLESHTGRVVSASTAESVSRLLRGAPLQVAVDADGTTLVPARPGADALVGRIAAALVEATLSGTWPRLKVCGSDTCRFAFFDHSKNGSGTWCTMRVCGSRAKARAYRQRRRTETAPA